MSDGSCLKDAFLAAQVHIPPDLVIPDWTPIETLPEICGRLGLEWFGKGSSVKIGIEPVIAIYDTEGGTGHAVFVEDIGPLIGNVVFCGLIRFPKTSPLTNTKRSFIMASERDKEAQSGLAAALDNRD